MRPSMEAPTRDPMTGFEGGGDTRRRARVLAIVALAALSTGAVAVAIGWVVVGGELGAAIAAATFTSAAAAMALRAALVEDGR